MKLSLPSQLLLRNLETFAPRFALINPPQDALLNYSLPALTGVYSYDIRSKTATTKNTISTCDQTRTEHSPYEIHIGAEFSSNDIKALFNNKALSKDTLSKGTLSKNKTAPKNKTLTQNYVMFWPKAKQQGLMMLEHWLSLLSSVTTEASVKTAASVTTNDSTPTLYLIGENRSGLKAMNKVLTPRGIQLNKCDSARHCLLYRVDLTADIAAFNLDDWVKSYEIALDGSALKVNHSKLSIHSLPGVFSQGALDKGTQLLLENLPPLSGNRFADIGSGAGVIAAFIAKQYPKAQVIASDVSTLALYSSARTAKVNQLNNLNVLASDGLHSYEANSLDAIVSNPPFHEGLNTHYEVTHQLFQHAKRCLKPRGQLVLVANQFLDYETQLQQHFANVSLVKQAQGFKILFAQ